ncbi:hypothetical protein KGF56_000235 [Candida oxycetoniae]|uniref:Proteasome assembly chaperone 1 n=1 Tax=Candida oxycetoniae TaxID=497107 RepID=A0AAI9T1K6_9ASCO|nr:uncharacterized protein KGF56_000235 [Candida oxycetoniae]KAI3406942.1 hypothetical protein KGF56_000235 [Candida oxycetoniae]
MLIKPITEVRNPRHTLDDDDLSNAQPCPFPEIRVVLDASSNDYDYIFVVPHTMKILQTELTKNHVVVGNIIVDYHQLYSSVEKESATTYDEDEQLYEAMKHESLKSRFPPKLELPIYLTKGVLSIVVPHFENVIIYNLLARQVVKHLDLNKEWILLAPSNLNNNQTINKLQLYADNANPVINNVPLLRPPHVITGFCAALLSQLNIVEAPLATALVLDSEGPLGFEKSDNDAIVDTATVLSSLFNIKNGEEYVKNVSLKVRKLNGYSNLGMYI